MPGTVPGAARTSSLPALQRRLEFEPRTLTRGHRACHSRLRLEPFLSAPEPVFFCTSETRGWQQCPLFPDGRGSPQVDLLVQRRGALEIGELHLSPRSLPLCACSSFKETSVGTLPTRNVAAVQNSGGASQSSGHVCCMETISVEGHERNACHGCDTPGTWRALTGRTFEKFLGRRGGCRACGGSAGDLAFIAAVCTRSRKVHLVPAPAARRQQPSVSAVRLSHSCAFPLEF